MINEVENGPEAFLESEAEDKPVGKTRHESSSEEVGAQSLDKQDREAIVALRKLTTEEDGQHTNVTLRHILGGDILTGKWLRRQFGLIILISVFTIIYISNRYSSQQEFIEIDRLRKELQDIKYDALTRSSELLERSRQSRIQEYLKATNDSSLQTATTPPFVIKIDGE